MKKLTVAISCYNFENYIEQCVKSILDQKTNFDFDILIKDDLSRDNSREIIKSLSRKYSHQREIKYIFEENNLGVNRNVASLLRACEGQYIALIDGDDFYGDENKLQRQVDFLEANPEYVLHSTSYKYIYNNGEVSPDDGRWFCPIKENVTLEDVLESNIVTFGRTFKNLKFVFNELVNKRHYIETPYDDWSLNYEILKNGKAKCEDYFSGYYRITGTGVMTGDSEKQRQEKHDYAKNLIKEDYSNLIKSSIKPIFIISTHVTDAKSEQILRNHISSLQIDYPKMIISNCKLNESILSEVDYFLYSREAKLFSEDLTARDVDLWKNTEHFELHDINPSYQKHALAILVNLDNALRLAKSMGFTHFFRIEGDSFISQKGNEFINSTPKLCLSNNKKGIFYHNKPRNEDDNISTHFFYSEIDFFLETMTRIKSEEDYKEFLSNYGISGFINLEEFFYKNLSNSFEQLIIRSGENDTDKDFTHTKWNQIVSDQNLPSKYRGCTTKIYTINIFPDGVSSIANLDRGEETDVISILSQNYKDRDVIRDIEVVLKDGNTINIRHHLPYNGSWAYNNFNRNVESIRVYENSEFLYEEGTNETRNYIVFKN